MRTLFTAAIMVLVVFYVCSCSNTEKARDNIFRGMYESSNQYQEMKHEKDSQKLDDDVPTYDEYKQERQKIITKEAEEV